MNTQTHVLIASVLFARPEINKRARNIAAISGGFFPDFSIFAMFAWSKLTGAPEMEVWEKWYFNPQWQFWIDAGNSFPLFGIVLIMGVAIVKWGGRNSDHGIILVIFALAAMTHLAGDFFLHVNDAHAHFWPLSEWRFTSPVSYWDPRYFGQYASIAETILGIGLCTILFRRFHGKWVRSILLLSVAAYIAVPAYFIFAVSHH